MDKLASVAVSVFLFAVLAVTNQAFAQPPGGDYTDDSGTMMGPPRGRGPMMGGSPQDRLMMMTRYLNLTDEQKKKIKPILDEEAGKIKVVRDDSSLTQDQKREKVRAIHAATYERIKPLLTAEQLKKHEEMMTRAGEWRWQMASPEVRLEKMGKDLNLTAEQKAKIKPILEREQTKMKSIHEDSTLTREQMREQMMTIHRSTYDEIKSILTPEQVKRHESMERARMNQ